MPVTLKTVAVLVANPALASILTSTLVGVRTLRVRPFETPLALATYLRLVPADLVVIDLDHGQADIFELARALRDDPGLVARKLQILALTGTLDADSKRAAIAAGIDEIIVKPMSPRYLVERVLARLLRVPAQPVAAMPRRAALADWSRFGDNVIPLFGRKAELGPRPI